MCSRSGGAIYIEMPSSDDALVHNTRFENNTAKTNSGGAVAIIRSRKVILKDLEFTSNTAAISGGALTVDNSNENITVSGCIFNYNVARDGDGSAIHLSDGNSFLSIYSCRFSGNSAPNGIFHCLLTIVLHACPFKLIIYIFEFLVGGGTLYWTFSQFRLLEPTGLHDGANEFLSSNNALYGQFYATQGIYLLVGDDSVIDVVDYEYFIPSFNVELVDYYTSRVLSQSEKEVSVETTPSNCYKSSGYLAGGTTTIWNGGLATFDRLQAYCAPGHSLNLLISYISSKGNVNPEANLTLMYRHCVRGEYLAQDRACALCLNGTYSFVEPLTVDLSELSEAAVCSNCPDYSKTCYGDRINVLPGYWRRSNDSSTLLKCPFESNSCSGGYDVGDNSCQKGFDGPRCGVCRPDYIYSPFARSCTECDSSYVEITIIFSIIALFSALLWFFYRKYTLLKRTFDAGSAPEVFSILVMNSKLIGENISEKDRVRLQREFNYLKKTAFGIMRVFLTFLQIITVCFH